MKRRKLFWGIIMVLSVLLAYMTSKNTNAQETIFSEDFEGGWGDWYPDNGVWEVGEPTAGPGSAHGGLNCAGTFLAGDYPAYTDSRLIYNLPHQSGIDLPTLTGDEELHLRFWHWYSYSSYDYGYIQIQVQDGSDWETVPLAVTISGTYGKWTQRDVDISAYAGKTIKIGFLHTADRNIYGDPSESVGWYIDDVEIFKMIPVWSGDFESGRKDWTVDNEVWEVGTPSVGPGGAFNGDQCASTVLDGNYPGYRDSRLISPSIDLPEVSGNFALYLRFWQWFSYSRYDEGYVQISVCDESSKNWSSWETIGFAFALSSSVWTPVKIDISAYSDQKVRFAFTHTADRNIYGDPSESTGWFIDNIEIIERNLRFSGDFEYGWDDWTVRNGVWQVGTPTAGPGNAYDGSYCGATVLSGNYPGYTDSRLTSPPIAICSVGSAFIRFWQWWSYSSYDYGDVQISVWDYTNMEWSSWATLPGTNIAGSSTVWTPKYIDLSDHVGEIIRIGFRHVAERNIYGDPSESSGWYIDNIEFPGVGPAIDHIAFDEYVDLPGDSGITVTATDPCEGDLTYNWDAPEGGNIYGSEAEVDYEPPELRFCPYPVTISVCSDVSHICSFVKTVKIYTRLPGDANWSGRVDILDKRIVRDAYGSEPGDSNWDERADVNCDGRVDILDKRLVRDYYGQRGSINPE